MHKLLREGNSAYKEGDYKTAEENYRKSLEVQSNDKGRFNLGNAIFKQQRYADAIKQYDEIASKSNSPQLKADAFYNKGNAHFWTKEYDKAIEAYKQALRIRPQDEEAKKNLAKAKRMLQEQQKQQQKQDQNKEQNKQDNKDQQNKNQEQNDPNKQEQQHQQNTQNQNQQQQQPNPQEQKQQDLKKEDAKRMLQIMDDEERKVQERLKKGKPQPSRSTKDW